MPLIKSGSKKAFSENVRTEMHHGKPQKQALAIAYSNMRKYGHSMSTGGVCESCQGTCKYAQNYDDGGKVESEYDKAGEAISGSISPEKAKKMKSWFGAPTAEAQEVPKHYAEGDIVIQPDKLKQLQQGMKSTHLAKGGRIEGYSDIKGVHKTEHYKGHSMAGDQLRDVKHLGPNAKEAGHNIAKRHHKNVLSELEEMPNPKLKGLAHGGEVTLHNDAAKRFMTAGDQDVGESEYALPHGLAKGGKLQKPASEELSEIKSVVNHNKAERNGSAESVDHELMEMMEHELREAIKNNDEEAILDMFYALMDMKG